MTDAPIKQEPKRTEARSLASVWRVCAALGVLVVVPVIMAWSWICYFAVYLGMAPDFWNCCLAISGIAAAYSLDRILDLDPRLADESYAGLPTLLRALFVIAVCVSLLCLWMSAASQWPIVCLCAGLSAGNWLAKKITGAKTLFVTAAWTCACFFLPFVDPVVNAHVLGSLFLWMPIFAISCIMCDIKDVSFDRLRRIRSLPVAMDVKETRRFIMILLVLIALVAAYCEYSELALLCLLLMLINQSKRILENMLLSPLCVDLSLCVVPLAFVLYKGWPV